jgi:hypothetical protein
MEWAALKPSAAKIMNQGRRTHVTIDKPVPVDSTGMEGIDIFWDAARNDTFATSSPDRLFSTTPDRPVTLSATPTQDSPSPIRPSPAARPWMPSPPRRPPRARLGDVDSRPRFAATPSISDGMSSAIAEARETSPVQLPAPSPFKPKPKPQPKRPVANAASAPARKFGGRRETPFH